MHANLEQALSPAPEVAALGGSNLGRAAAHRTKATAEIIARLPPGEAIVWQGAPRWQNVAAEVFHVRLVAVYFVAYAILQGVTVVMSEGSAEQGAFSAAVILAIAAPALAILCGIAWLVARTTLYTITSGRVLLNVGMALPKTFNIPLQQIESVAVKSSADGTGSISLKLSKRFRLGGLFLWPHVRPWRFSQPEPTLRAVPGAPVAAGLLGQQLRAGLASAEAEPEAAPVAEASTVTPKRPSVPLPMRLLMGFILLAAVLVVGSRVFGIGGSNVDYGEAEVVKTVQFQPLPAGRAQVVAVETGEAIGVLQPTDDGVVRGAIRAFERGRIAAGHPAGSPYQVIRWRSGAITLTDPRTGDHVPLDAFGPIGPSVTRDLLTLVAP
ncbi:MAG: photosynthetic complex putative assembly protein PuhB [Pseudomonadota bacterium]